MNGKRDRRQEPQVEYRGQPSQKPQPTPKPKRNPLDELIGERVIIQSRAGVMYTGILMHNESGLLRLEDCTIQGIHHTAKSKWVLVDRTMIAHVHPADARIDKVE